MTKNKKLVIIGTGETAILAYEYFHRDSPYEVVAFAVDREYRRADTLLSLPVVELEKLSTLFPADRYELFVAMSGSGLSYPRADMYSRVKQRGYHCASYVSSCAFVWHNVKIGENCFILEDNTLQPFTEVGNNVVMWSGNHLGHRSRIGDHCFISSHVVISGFCSIGSHTFIGVNSCVADGVEIAADNYIAMGSAVTKNTEPDRVYRGVPAMATSVSARLFSNVKG